MIALEIIGTVLIAVIVAALFFYGFRTTGPWGSFWSFLLILFLGILFVDAWADPIGPLWYGVAWLDLIFVGLVFAFLLAAASPARRPRVEEQVAVEEAAKETNDAAVALGVFFWFMLIFFVAAIFAGLWLR